MGTVRNGVRMKIDVEVLLYILMYVTSRMSGAKIICLDMKEDLHSYYKVM